MSDCVAVKFLKWKNRVIRGLHYSAWLYSLLWWFVAKNSYCALPFVMLICY